ncbi:capsular polysaccharide export protein, LipB/KpsS family [Microvirga lotononidis]|uniref:Capsule polysaccharide export protein n=1 Tax=Microvirga lotononidis TaxID=864069 RepID=I4YQC8_9HYPH|nr:capsule polysaccharide export protein [Microvirga lotononidis]EIM26170.1 capsule polysaccharide export protein [Microvirga lotononidis]WQO26072.1 hypothetical protein U0023_15325 [Microvirga lotononidis]
MRILIYIEPHPIRDSMVAQLHVANYFARMFMAAGQMPPDYDYRLYSNANILTTILSEFPSVKDLCLMPTVAEQALFQRNLVPWLERGMHEWIALAHGEGLAYQYHKVLADIHARFPFDLLVHWGANGAVDRFCNDNGLGRVTMELGCTRSPYNSTIVFDPNGVSGSASPSLVDIADLRTVVGSKGSSAELDLMTYSGSAGRNLYEARFDYNAALDEQIMGMAAGRRIAFLPLPAHDDPNLQLYSRFSTPTEVVDQLLPQLTEAGFFCLVKPHPAMRTRPSGGAEHFRVREVIFRSPSAFCIDSQMGASANIRLIELSDVLVTVASSVGFEATLHNKPVCVLGKAIYKPSNVFPSLDDVKSQRIFEQDFDNRYKHETGVLRSFFLDAYLVPEKSAFDLTVFTDRVRQLSGLRGPAAEIVQSIYRQFGSAGRQQRLVQFDRQPPSSASTPTKQEQDELLANVQARVSALLNSTSWRVTRPLRLTSAKLRGVDYIDPREPRSVQEGIRTIERIMSSGSWAISWPMRLVEKGWAALRR